MTDAVAVRFWSHVEPRGRCWEWTASRTSGGYGKATAEGRRSVMAHRLVWRMFYGPIPTGLLVLHDCDNPPCVRPTHLSLGTYADNMRDMVARGRKRGGSRPRLGPPKPRRRYSRPIWLVTDDLRARIIAERRTGAFQQDIAREVGLSQASVSKVLKAAGMASFTRKGGAR